MTGEAFRVLDDLLLGSGHPYRHSVASEDYAAGTVQEEGDEWVVSVSRKSAFKREVKGLLDKMRDEPDRASADATPTGGGGSSSPPSLRRQPTVDRAQPGD